MIAEVIREDDARFALELVQAICAQVGPGLPGSPQERERAAMIQKELEAHLGAENVAVEEFTFAPGAHLSLYPGLFLLLAVLLNLSIGCLPGVPTWLTALAALGFAIAAPALFILEFILGHELIDPCFKKAQSVNVIGSLRKPGSGRVKRLLILSGHHDSAPENLCLRYFGYGFFFFAVTLFIGFFTMLVMSGLQLVGVIAALPAIIQAGTMGWILLAYPMAPAVLFGLFAIRKVKGAGTVPGAADNLSACALTAAMCRFLAKNPACIPDNTEIRFITFGSEEVGVRGSRRYVQRHLDELKLLDVRLLNYETIAIPEIAILSSETNGSVKNSPEMVQSVVAAAQRAGAPYKVQPATLGAASDAGPFSQAGLKATTLVGFKLRQMVAFYHQKWDTPEVLSIEPLLNVLKLTLEWVRSGGE
jgi:hypothetical protein